MSDSQPPMSLELVPTMRRLAMRRHSVAVTRRPVAVGFHCPVGLGSLRQPCGGGGLFFFSPVGETNDVDGGFGATM